MISLGLDSGLTEVTVNEGGVSRPAILTITIRGTVIFDIPVRIVPLTYLEFEAMLSSSLLSELFPTRPINAASGIQYYQLLF